MSDRIRNAPLIAGMAMKIGVMGAATGRFSRDHLEKARRLGETIARRGCVLVTGACPGLPEAAAKGAKHRGGFVVGISPGLSLDEHIRKFRSPTQHHDVLIYTGSGLMGREVVNIRSSDIVIIIGGRSGTLGELAIAYDEGKLIGVLTGTGGISDIADRILAACKKDTGARVVYSGSPETLVDELLRVYQRSHFRRPSCFHGLRTGDVAVKRKAGMQRDVVCGMWVRPAAAAARRRRDGQWYVFCSQTCAERFDAASKPFNAPGRS